jgi:hypothetical protein
MTPEEEMKQHQYGLRIEQMCVDRKMPTLTEEQVLDLVERLMKIPGTVTCIDLCVVIRLYCREMKCTAEGPVYE